MYHETIKKVNIHFVLKSVFHVKIQTFLHLLIPSCSVEKELICYAAPQIDFCVSGKVLVINHSPLPTTETVLQNVPRADSALSSCLFLSFAAQVIADALSCLSPMTSLSLASLYLLG